MIKVLHTESSLAWGGQEIRIVEESLGMSKRGYHVIIAAPENSLIYKRARQKGIRCIPLNFSKKDPGCIGRMISILKKERPHILNTHSSTDSWIASMATLFLRKRPRLIRTRHLSTPISRSFTSKLIYNVLPDAIITTGEAIRKRMIEYNGFDPSRIFSIPTGVDLERFDPSRVRPSLPRKGFTIGMVSVLRSWKGHKYFIKAIPEILTRIPDAHFYIVGTGPNFQGLEDIIRKLSLTGKVTMTGHREDIPEVLASLHILVHPSYANEGVPQTILQALAMERPVVASDVGGIGEVIIDGKTGFLIKPKDVNGIVQKVVELYTHLEICKSFGMEGRNFVKHNYSFSIMLDKIERVYNP